MHYVYVLISLKDRKFYIGYSEDVSRREKDHNSGKNLSTKSRRPLKMFYYEAHFSKQDAMKRERYFKTARGKTTLKQIAKHSIQELLKG